MIINGKWVGGGYRPEPRKPTDYIKGVNSPLVMRGVSNIDWRTYRPDLYLQQKNGFDSDGCVSWAAVQDIETQLNYSYQNNQLTQSFRTFLETNRYVVNNKIVCSKMYIATLSGTTPGGNGFSNVATAITHYGLIPDWMYPFNPTNGESWQQVYQYPTAQMIQTGALFNLYLKIGYHYLSNISSDSLIRDFSDGPIQIAIPICPGYTTDTPVNSCGLAESHSVIIDYIDPQGEKEIVDHYPWYLRLLSSSYPIPAAMQYVISEITTPVDPLKYVISSGFTPEQFAAFPPEVQAAIKFNDRGGQNIIVNGGISERDPRFIYP